MPLTLHIQHAMLMRLIVICCLPESTIFFILPRKCYNARENIIEHKVCFSSLQHFTDTFLIPQGTSSTDVQIYSSTRLHKSPSNGRPSCAMRQTDRQTDTTKQVVAFRNFVHAHNKQ